MAKLFDSPQSFTEYFRLIRRCPIFASCLTKKTIAKKAVFGAIDSESPYRKKALSKRERPSSFLADAWWESLWGSSLSSVTTYFLVAHTPLTPYLVPGFVAESFHEDAKDAKAQTDSALATLETHERYLNSIKVILEGGVPEFDGVSSLDSMLRVEDSLPNAGEGDLELRNKVEQEDRFALKKAAHQAREKLGSTFLLLTVLSRWV